MKKDTTTLAGTAILAALVVVFDYTLKYSNLKIPFPLLPFLKFDFTGIPIVLSLLIFGPIAGTLTSAVAFVAILARSGDIIGSLAKSLAEFSTILGIAVSLKLINRVTILGSLAFGITSRVLIMTCLNLILISIGFMSLPQSYVDIPFLMVLVLGAFNIIQGAISVIGGYSVYETVKRRAPSIIQKVTG